MHSVGGEGENGRVAFRPFDATSQAAAPSPRSPSPPAPRLPAARFIFTPPPQLHAMALPAQRDNAQIPTPATRPARPPKQGIMRRIANRQSPPIFDQRITLGINPGQQGERQWCEFGHHCQRAAMPNISRRTLNNGHWRNGNQAFQRNGNPFQQRARHFARTSSAAAVIASVAVAITAAASGAHSGE